MSVARDFVKRITNYNDARSIGSTLRRRRIKLLLPLIDATYEKYHAVRILDIGGTRAYWNIVDDTSLDSKNVHITVINVPSIESPPDDKHFSYLQGDGCNLSMLEDKSFHIAHSNSVLEHVGDWSRMLSFAEEVRRVAEMYFVQTPNYWFPVEPHCMTPFFHWLPKPTRIWLVMRWHLGHWNKAESVSDAVSTIEGARLLNRKMLKELFKDASIASESILGFRKSYIAVKQ